MTDALIVGVFLVIAFAVYQFQTRRAALAQLEAREREHALVIRWLQLRISHLERLLSFVIEHGDIGDNQRRALSGQRDFELSIYQILKAQFNLEELQSLAFEVGLTWDNVAGATLDTRAISLIQSMSETGRIDVLVAALRKRRPDAKI